MCLASAGRRSDQINGSVQHSALDSRPLYCGHMSPKPVSKNQPTPGRILMIVENGNYPGDPRVATEARTLRDWGYAVTVIGPNDKTVSNQRTIDGVKVYQFPHIHFFSGILGYALEYGSAALAIATLTAYVYITQGFDIVHVANPPDFIVPLVSIYKLFGKRIIFDQHDLTPELYAARF